MNISWPKTRKLRDIQESITSRLAESKRLVPSLATAWHDSTSWRNAYMVDIGTSRMRWSCTLA